MQLSNSKVLVTGGAGFIGNHLVRALVGLGAAVRVVDNLARGKLTNLQSVATRIEFHAEDLRDAQVSEAACRDVDVVFHLASRVGGIGYYVSHPCDVLHDNVVIDANVMGAALKAGVARYVYASSAHVYPEGLQSAPDALPIREEQAIPASPGLSYGWAKLLGEKGLEYATAQWPLFRAAIVRIAGAYGPGQDCDLANGSVIPVLIRRAIEYPGRQPFTVLGTGAETRSYCYVKDIVRGMLIACDKLEDHRLIGPVNLAAEGVVSIRDLALEIIRISGKDIEPTFDDTFPTRIWGQSLDCLRARAELDGWSSTVSLAEGLRYCYRYLEQRLMCATSGSAHGIR